MSDHKKPEINVFARSTGLFTAVTLLIIAFWGEPDLIDAIVYALTGEYPQ